ncbi:hypothetical protein [Nocardiopsis sp. MG754419]|uniref:hypothetical protein n=1 Tax=Nocardiopsis sp. MG754419 TaxID=2259865 RepID=UPI001BAE29DE|nr:hypothetical protein [Nocardiopsis sp. MG754419]MBR8740306.1 hypothetical protein [Nocardiopsis sp. MG754419]
MGDSAGLSPTELISAWIPHDARFRASAVRHAHDDATGRRLHVYVDGLVNRGEDDGRPLDRDELRTMTALREDLERRPLASVDWRTVRDRLIDGLG